MSWRPAIDPSTLPQVGGLPLAVLEAGSGDGVVRAVIAPGRGMMLVQARARLDGRELELIEAPPLAEVPAALARGDGAFPGNGSFGLGGAILLPFANRIRGRAVDERTIQAPIDGHPTALLANWSGRAPGSERYAMHGLVLALPVAELHQPSPDRLEGRVLGHDFDGRWPGRADLAFTWALHAGGLELTVDVTNRGDGVLPIGAGWHPYFRIPSGDRAQARLHVPARRRLEVGEYDAVLPTGALLDVAGSALDVARPGGLELGAAHLDDCFVDLAPTRDVVAELLDPRAGLRVRVRSEAPPVRAVQVYAPVDRPVIALEPQLNWTDPFSPRWPASVDNGVVRLAAGARGRYHVRVELLSY